jgi:penicillin-binding protein 1A
VVGTDVEADDPRLKARPLQAGAMAHGVIVSVSPEEARLELGTRQALLPRSAASWTRARSLEEILTPSDLVLVRLPDTIEDDGAAPLIVSLLQEPAIEGALIAIDNSSGAILAMVGSFDFSRNQFNRATQSRLQCGSAFKPIVALTALEHGFTLADTIFDAPFLLPDRTSEPTYCPKNFYPRYYGITTLRRAIELSFNASAVKLQHMVGTDAVIETARRLGLSSELQPVASLALGSIEVRLVELVRAYAAVPNLGLLPPPPFTIRQVADRDHAVLRQTFAQGRRVTSPQVAYLLLNLLQGVVERGTAQALKPVDLAVAGKTGTTDDYTDAWFLGCSPRITVGVWVGRDRKAPIGPHMSGSVAALPIWKHFIEAYASRLSDDQRALGFPVPPGVVMVPIDRLSGKRATLACSDVILEAFLIGTDPTVRCSEQDHLLDQLPWPFQLPSYTPQAGEPMPTAAAIQVADRRLAAELGIELEGPE